MSLKYQIGYNLSSRLHCQQRKASDSKHQESVLLHKLRLFINDTAINIKTPK